MRSAPQLTPLPNTSLPQKHPMHQTSYYHEPSLNLYPSLCLPSFVPTWRGDIYWEKDEEELTYDQSLTQLLLYGLAGGDQDQKDNNINNNAILDGKPRLFENWCLHQQYQQAPSPKASSSITDTIKEETVINSPPSDNYPNCLFGHHANDDFKVENSAAFRSTNNSCNKSCVTSLRENSHPDPVPDRKSTNNSKRLGRDRFSEFEGRVSGGNTQKKAKNHSNSRNQDNFKVIKEKLGDRITTLHQLVSPFGKTDTASVLLEAIGYIRFLQSQIEALSSPYFGGSAGTKHQKTEFHGESKIDLRSRGLCLVPISCTIRVVNDGIDGDDFWTPAKRSPPGWFR